MDLKGRVAIVTGGTGGLGMRIARTFVLRGIRVALCYNQGKDVALRASRELGDLGGEVIPLQVDLEQEESVQRLVDETIRAFGRIDILVNDAAYTKWIPWPQLEDLSLADWNKILAVNLTGPFLCTKAVAPIMKRQKSGRIVNISSGSGFSPHGSSIPYAVSKAGLIHLTKCMAVALAPEILVNCVAPGFMEDTRASEKLTELYKEKVRQQALLKRSTDKDDIAEIVVEFSRTESITGQTLVIDSGRFFH
jgi:3-oxoacyl-[acyl-carrier protein] reductase